MRPTLLYVHTHNLLVQTCHKRGCHAIGGMAAQIPIKNDLLEGWCILPRQKVRHDKIREVKDGHDGTWVAHPDVSGCCHS